MKGNTVSSARLLKIFDSDWYSQKVDTDIHYKDEEDEMRLVVLGKEMLGLYVREARPSAKGAEVPFTVPLVHPATGEALGVNLEGFFDLVETDDTIVEFKTSAQAMNPSDIHAHLQLTAYGYAFELLQGRPPRGFKVVNFIKNKRPRIEVTETSRGKVHYEAFFFIAEQVLRGILKGVFPPRQGFWCKECEYRSICPLWKSDGATASGISVGKEAAYDHARR